MQNESTVTQEAPCPVSETTSCYLPVNLSDTFAAPNTNPISSFMIIAAMNCEAKWKPGMEMVITIDGHRVDILKTVDEWTKRCDAWAREMGKEEAARLVEEQTEFVERCQSLSDQISEFGKSIESQFGVARD